MVHYFHFKLEKFPILINLHTSVKFSAGAGVFFTGAGVFFAGAGAGAGGEKTGVCTALVWICFHAL